MNVSRASGARSKTQATWNGGAQALVSRGTLFPSRAVAGEALRETQLLLRLAILGRYGFALWNKRSKVAEARHGRQARHRLSSTGRVSILPHVSLVHLHLDTHVFVIRT